MRYEVVTNGKKYRVKDADTGMFLTNFKVLPYGSVINSIVEFDNFKDAAAAARENSWYTVHGEYK